MCVLEGSIKNVEGSIKNVVWILWEHYENNLKENYFLKFFGVLSKDTNTGVLANITY